MSKCLVTGGAGFIGCHVASELINRGESVIVLDDMSGGFRKNVPQKAKFIEGSIVDVSLLKTIFESEKIEYVFHLAAYAAEGLSHFIKTFNYKNNVIGSMNLINYAVNYNVKAFVFTSSIAVYGTNQLPMTEDITPLPEDSYGIAKYTVELDLHATYKMFGMPYIIFRPHNVYGEKQNIGDPYRNVIGIFMNQIMQSKPMTIFGDGNQNRAFTYISDVAPIIAESIKNNKAYCEIFNIGADTPCNVNHLSKVVAQAMGVEANVVHLKSRNEVVNAYSSHKKVQRIFNYSPVVPLEEGVQRMAAWAKKIGPGKSKKFNEIEISKNLPPSWRRLIG